MSAAVPATSYDNASASDPRMAVPDILKSVMRVGLVAALFAIIFAPALFLDFGFHNDYSLWSYNHRKCCAGFPETAHLLWTGRPIGAFLLNFHFMWFNSVAALAVGRAVSLVFLLAALALTTTIMARSVGVWPRVALAHAILIFLLPASLLYVLWLAHFVPGTLNVLLATIAYFLVEKSYSKESPLQAFHLASSGYGTLLVAFYIYPPTAYFFLVFTFAKVVFTTGGRWRIHRREVIGELTGCFLVGVVCLGSIKLFALFLVKAVFGPAAPGPPGGAYQVALAWSLAARTPVIRDLFAMVTPLWFVDFLSLRSCTWIMGILFLIGLFWGLVRWKLHVRRDVWERAAFCIILLGASASPSIASVAGFAAIRNTFATSAMLAVCLGAILVRIDKSAALLGGVPLSLVILCIAASIVAAMRITAVAYNEHAELEFIRHQVAQFDNAVKTVILLQPPVLDVIGKGPLTQDFRLMATNRAPIVGIIRAAMNERGLPGNDIQISSLPWKAPHI